VIDLLGTIWLVTAIAALFSVSRDFATHERRMTKWEEEYPGQMYIRGYRRIMKGAPDVSATA
jgi:hypothetical protein